MFDSVAKEPETGFYISFEEKQKNERKIGFLVKFREIMVLVAFF